MLGLEARPAMHLSAFRALQDYDPNRIIEDARFGERLYRQAKSLYGSRVKKMLIGFNIGINDASEVLMEKARVPKTAFVPAELGSAVALSLLEKRGIITIATIIMPGAGGSIRFSPRAEIAKEFGPPEEAVRALDDSFDRIASKIEDIPEIGRTILGRYYMNQGNALTETLTKDP